MDYTGEFYNSPFLFKKVLYICKTKEKHYELTSSRRKLNKVSK
jgi:hypothetical protein